jgi:hypothetical protein
VCIEPVDVCCGQISRPVRVHAASAAAAAAASAEGAPRKRKQLILALDDALHADLAVTRLFGLV